jgi:anti-sigma B factor antagonist
MDITAIEHGDVTVLAFNGSLDATTAEKADDHLAAQFSKERYKLVIDMSDVEFMSSAGLRTLLNALRVARRSGGDVRLAAGSQNIKRVLGFSGFTKVMNYYDEVAQAVDSYSE